MNKQVKIILAVLCVILIWVVLALINAGPAGLGVVLSILAVFDISGGKFQGDNRTAWLIVALAGLLTAIIGIASVLMRLSDAQGNFPVYTICTVISIILPLVYFFTGRRQKTSEKD
ncbi:MAG: hypothetical protein JXL81_10820 [Deltaproteobacteria bacterium]|nr:hypothetical protein [Deltaproteobacteria bacterium]